MKYTTAQCEQAIERYHNAAEYDLFKAALAHANHICAMLRERLTPQPIEVTDAMVDRAEIAYDECCAQDVDRNSFFPGWHRDALHLALVAALTEPTA